MAYAPDKDDPFPKPRGGKGGNKGGRGNGNSVPNVLGPGGVASLAEDMAEEFGGSKSAWRKDIRQPFKSNFNWGNGGNGGGRGGKDGPGVNVPVDPGKPFPNGPDTFGPRRAAAPRGLFDAAPQAAQAPSRGLLSQAVPNAPQTQQAPQQPQQAQLPPEILAWVRANQMRR